MPNNRTNTTLLEEDVIRIPLVASYNTRNLDASSNSSSSLGIVGIGIVGVMIVGSTSSSTKDTKFVNCFPEKVVNHLTGTPKYYVTKRPGWAALNTPSAGNLGSALKVWSVNSDKVISAFGTTNSNIYDGTTLLGAITGQATFLEETLIGSTPYMVCPSSDNTCWYTTGGAPTQISDGDFPGNASRTITGNIVFVDGFMFIMDTSGRVYNSDFGSVTSWTAGSYIEANIYPDNGIGLARYKNMIVAFGKESVEFFYNSGQNPVGSPLSRYEQGFVHFGCVNQYAYTQLEDTVAWVSASDRSGIGLYILDGLQPKRVSTPSIDTQLSLVNSATVYVSSGKFFGKTWISIVTSSTTFIYCVEDDMWHEWGAASTVWHHITGTTSGTRLNYAISRTDTGGKVFVVNPSQLVYNDNGTVFTMTCQTSKFDGDTIKYKFLNKLSIVADKNSSTNNLNIQWTDDDYQTFSAARTIDLNSNNPYIMNCGKFSRRAFKFTNSTDNPVRLEAMELQLKQGIH